MDICPACGDILVDGECWSCGYSERREKRVSGWVAAQIEKSKKSKKKGY